MSASTKDGQQPSQIFIRNATGLTRQLSAKDVLMFNLLNMGLAWPLLYIFFAGLAYQGINTPITVLIGLPGNLVIALLFYYLTTAFPRTGGDYVWVSRLVHPAIGFMESFAVVVFFLGFIGPVAGWFVTFGLAGIFNNLGVATGNTSYFSLATSLSSTNSVLVGSLVVLAAIVLGAVFGTKISFRYQWATFILMFVGIVTFLVVVGTTSQATFQSNLQSLGNTSYNGIIQAASKSGFITAFTFGGTLIGSFYSFLNYLGYYLSAYVGGEVKQSNRSQFIGIIGSILIFALIAFLMFFVPFQTMGGSFINSASLLASSGNSTISSQYTLPMAPVTSFLAIFANPNPLVGILIPLAIIGSVFGSLETIVFSCVRIIFAWSFDGVVPTKFADVDRRGSPNYTLGLFAVVGLAYVLLSVYAANSLTFLAYTTSGIFIAIAFVGLAGIMLPYKHKDLFRLAPPNVQRKIGGVPVIALLGVATIIVAVFVAYTAASPVFTGAPVNPVYLAGLALVFIVGLVIYAIAYYYNKSKGFNLALRFAEVPPE
ncbi:MAG: APC family permease [Thaumarchaeota archaeon]|nr:APC family permease [Nitrososphaerota archaeon]